MTFTEVLTGQTATRPDYKRQVRLQDIDKENSLSVLICRMKAKANDEARAGKLDGTRQSVVYSAVLNAEDVLNNRGDNRGYIFAGVGAGLGIGLFGVQLWAALVGSFASGTVFFGLKRLEDDGKAKDSLREVCAAL